MQFDMHFYGTYAMAAAAGIPKQDAEVIATAAQFVDDQNFQKLVTAKTGEGILGIATAHHPLEAGVRASHKTDIDDDCRVVWVPFHFLPGNKGETFEERLITQKNSDVANAMLDHYLQPDTIKNHKTHALHLIGIAAHVYADTFSHYGFSGIASGLNAIKESSLDIDSKHSEGIFEHIQEQGDRFASIFTGASDLGHGAVLTYPDRPYLCWSFEYEDGRESSPRNNAVTFLEACEALYFRFAQFSQVYYDGQNQPAVTWDSIKDQVKAILEKEGSGNERADYWVAAIEAGEFPGIYVPKVYDENEWLTKIELLPSLEGACSFQQSDPYKFFVAADYHRNYILKRLLPSYGLMVA